MSDLKDTFLIEKNAEQKIIVAGTMGVGKTTAIKTLCDSFRIDDSNHAEPLDCGTLFITGNDSEHNDNGEKLYFFASRKHSYSEPSLSESSWKKLQNGMIGILLLIDNRRKDPLRDLQVFIEKFSDMDRQLAGKLVIGITHFDSSRTPAITDFHAFIGNLERKSGINPPIFSVDTRNFSDMSMLVQALLYTQNPRVNDLLSEELDFS